MLWPCLSIVYCLIKSQRIKGNSLLWDGCPCSPARTTDTRRELFFQKLETFGLGQTNWDEILWGIWGISGQTISTILTLWVSCPWESVAGSLSHKKLWFLGWNHITPKYSQNKILAIKNLGNSVHTSVFGGFVHSIPSFCTMGVALPKLI